MTKPSKRKYREALVFLNESKNKTDKLGQFYHEIGGLKVSSYLKYAILDVRRYLDDSAWYMPLPRLLEIERTLTENIDMWVSYERMRDDER